MNILWSEARIFKGFNKRTIKKQDTVDELSFLQHQLAKPCVNIRTCTIGGSNENWGGKQKREGRRSVKGFDPEFSVSHSSRQGSASRRSGRCAVRRKQGFSGRKSSSLLMKTPLLCFFIYFLHVFIFIFRITDILGIRIYHPLEN